MFARPLQEQHTGQPGKFSTTTAPPRTTTGSPVFFCRRGHAMFPFVIPVASVGRRWCFPKFLGRNWVDVASILQESANASSRESSSSTSIEVTNSSCVFCEWFCWRLFSCVPFCRVFQDGLTLPICGDVTMCFSACANGGCLWLWCVWDIHSNCFAYWAGNSVNGGSNLVLYICTY